MRFSILLVRKRGWLASIVSILTLSKWNHIAIHDTQTGIVHDFDVKGYSSYKFKSYKDSVLEVAETIYESSMLYVQTRKYSLLSNLNVFLDAIRFPKKIRFNGMNCVSFCIDAMGKDIDLRWKTPSYFERFKRV